MVKCISGSARDIRTDEHWFTSEAIPPLYNDEGFTINFTAFRHCPDCGEEVDFCKIYGVEPFNPGAKYLEVIE